MGNIVFDASDVSSKAKKPSPNSDDKDTQFVPAGIPKFRNKHDKPEVVAFGEIAEFKLRLDGARPLSITIKEGKLSELKKQKELDSAKIEGLAYGLKISIQTRRKHAGAHAFYVIAKNAEGKAHLSLQLEVIGVCSLCG